MLQQHERSLKVDYSDDWPQVLPHLEDGRHHLDALFGPLPEGSRFPTGSIYITRGAMEVIHPQEAYELICRHIRGDWGDAPHISLSARVANDVALQEHRRLFSIYRSGQGPRVWITTEADRSETTILMPMDW